MNARPSQPPALNHEDYLRFRALIQARSGLEFAENRRTELERGLRQVLVELALPNFVALYERCVTDESVPFFDLLFSKLTVGETYFFRNQPQFDALEQTILPALLEQRRALRSLRVWSAGCASGEEPYSVAMTLHRLMPDLAQWHLLLLATDVNRLALARARQAVYGEWSFRGVPAAVRQMYFTPLQTQWALTAHIRQLVTFSYLNLVEANYPALWQHAHSMDLILCRNVLIYFRNDTVQQVIQRLYDTLVEGGWLVVGHAEPSAQLFARFEAHHFPGTVMYRKPLAAKPYMLPVAPLPPPSPPPPTLAPRSDTNATPVSVSALPRLTPTPIPNVSRPSTKPLPLQPPKPETALALWERGQTVEAIQLLRRAVDAYPTEARSPYWLAKFYANQLEWEQAQQYLTVALQREPLLAGAYHLRGLILEELGQWDDALAALRRCVFADPDFVLGHFALARVCLQVQQPARARHALARVLSLLKNLPAQALVPEGDGLTVGQLQAMTRQAME